MNMMYIAKIIIYLLMLSRANGQTSTDDPTSTCHIGGWTYSASASGSTSYSSSSSSSTSSICVQANLPEDCITAHPTCQWCAQEDFSGKRCNEESQLLDQKCSDIQKIVSVTSLDQSNEGNRFNIQAGSARIRVGDSVTIPFRVKVPAVYPVDFYYLMDVSYSMRDDLKNVHKLASELIATLQELTKGGQGSVRIGFGKFVDKVQSPMTQMTEYKLKHPYGKQTDAPFLFKNVVDLTSDLELFLDSINNETVSGNLDPPEGALDAMLQVIQCQDVVRWRGNALRLMMVATESAYHYAADGVGFLAGISKANDGKCHTGADGIYRGAEDQDFPSVNQVVRALEEKSITPIFAIGSTYANLYEYVSNNVFRGSAWGILKGDSSNVVDLVRQAYMDITGKQELVTANPDEEVICTSYMATTPNGVTRDLSVHDTLIQGLDSGSKVFYNMSLSANRDACAGDSLCDIGNVVVKTRRYDDRLTVSTSVVSAFGCAANVVANSASCNGNGNFSCGICYCNVGWTGPACGILAGVAVGCLPSGGGLECSGRGRCLNEKCQCDPGYKHFKSKVYGDFCECDDCPKRAGLICSGNGMPKTDSCSCSCDCDQDWSGDDCSCANTTASCMGQNGLICSGYGECLCGSCVCTESSNYGGPTCGDCLENCPSCAIFKDCIQCRMHGSGPLNQTCETECADYTIYEKPKNSMKEEDIDPQSGKVLCAAIDDDDNCKFYYTYQAHPDGTKYYAENEKRCNSAYSLLIILWCILLFLLIGLILLCCWRCCVYVIDKEEAKNYRLRNLPMFSSPMIPLLPAMGAGSVIEFIKAKYLVRRSAKVAVIPVRRTFLKGETCVLWRTYPGSSEDNDYEVMSKGEEGTILRKRQAVEHLTIQGRNGESTIDIEPLEGRNVSTGYSVNSGYAGKSGATNGAQADQLNSDSSMRFEHVDETSPLMGNGLDWGTGEIKFKDDDEFCSIEIPLLHDFNGKETTFWVELYGQEKGVALGLKRTRVIVIKDEEAGIIGFPKPNYVFKESDGLAIVPVHRTVGMDGHVSVAWFTRDITGVSGKHYIGGRGVVTFADGEVTQHIEVPLISDILYDDTEKAFNIMLEDPKGGASLDLSHCMVTVLGDEECSLVQFPKEAYPFMENCGIAEVAVMRTRSTKGISTVNWHTEDDTAIAGKDYEASKGTITFANTETETHIHIPIIDNDVYDDSGRAFRIILAEPSEGTKLTHNIATISIIEDDEPGLFEFSKTNCVMRSKATMGRLTVIRSLGTDGHIAIQWRVRKMAANEIPDDVANLSGELYFENGEISKHLEIDVSHTENSDMMTFNIVLQDPSGGAKLGTKDQATVTVFAEEDFGTVSFAQQRFDVSATAGMVNLLVSRKGDISSAAFVVCETADRTAISGTHYRGGTISVVFDGGETVKEVGIPVYNDPNHAGQLEFGVTLRSTPGGAKIGDPSEAVVAITCIPMTPVLHARFAPPGPCTVEFIKSKYLFRRSAKYVVIPVHRSSGDGSCRVQWEATGPPSIMRPDSSAGNPRGSMSSSSSSSSESENDNTNWGEGIIRFADGAISTSIELCLDSRDMYVSQVSLQVSLLDLMWEENNGATDELRFGLKDTEVVILNDIDAGTLGFSKATFSFKESEGTVVIPVNRLGGMDGIVSARWRTADDTAFASRDYETGQGVITFANNQIGGKLEIKLLEGEFYGEQGERKFTIELDKFKGGAKSGIRKATVFIIGDEDRSVIQFSKDSYPVIGNSTSVKLPVLRTGSFQQRAVVAWRTVDGSAVGGVDFKKDQNVVVFEPGETRGHIEVQLAGKASEAKNFNVELSTNLEEVDSNEESGGKSVLGPNKSAIVSIINNQDPGTFEFGKSSFVFKTTTTDLGMIPVIRSGGTDGAVTIPWRIESLDQPSPFAGAEGFLKFKDGQVSANIEIGLEGIPSDVFVLILVPSEDNGHQLGSATRATITIIGELVEPTIEMDSATTTFKDVEVVQIKVLRKGNVTDATYVGWKTLDGTAIHNKNFIGGAGNLVFDPNETERNIMIPVLASPNDNPANFKVQLTDVRGTGKLNDQSETEVTLEPVPKTVVEFLRKRYLFRQSQGSSLIPVRRSNANGILSLRWNTETIKDDSDATQQVSSFRNRSRASSTSSSDGDEDMMQKGAMKDEDMEIDWGTGTVTFEDGDHEASIEIILCREMAQRESNFRIELKDNHDHVTLAVPSTMVTVIRDKDPGLLGFASPRYNFSCSEPQLIIPVHRSSGADGTVAVPWFTRDATAVGGMHYIPADGNLVFGDGEVLKKIVVPMPRRVGYFDEDEVAFKLCLGEPTGGAALSVYEAHVVLENDIVPAQITFDQPEITCSQSSGSMRVPVKRVKDTNGIVALSWQSRSLPGKPKSRYAGVGGTIVFDDEEEEKEIVMKLPVQVQPTNMDSFIIALEQPTSGRATLGDYQECTAKVDNDIIPGVFTLQKDHYCFKQSTGRDVIKVLRNNGTKGAVSLPWRVLPECEDAAPSPMSDLHGTVDFDDGQSEADITLRFPEDTDEDKENFLLVLLPPDGRAELDEPYRADFSLENDLKCEISFPKSEYDIRGDVDTFLVPVVRDGPKGRPAAVEYKTIDESAVDCQHYIGGEGILSFESGENKKDILVPIMNDPNGGRVTFKVLLCEVTGAAELGANGTATVNIDNITGVGYLEMMTSEMVVKQTSTVVEVVVIRKKGKKGAVDVPWFVERATPCVAGQKPDDYEDLGGTLNFLDGETEKTLAIPLCDKPQDDDVTTIDVTLLTPTSGSGVGLGEVTSTRCVIENDLDGGKIEFEHERVEVFGTDGEAHIPVVRSGGCNHACQVTWEANDDTAVRGKHYRAGKGNLSFAPNETKKDIVIPIVNDASGDVMYFNVTLTSTKGGTKLGSIDKTQVLIDHVKEVMQEIQIMQQAAPINVHGEIGFVDSDADVKQSSGEIVLAVERKTGNRGRVVVPWSIEDAPTNSPYKNLHGQETFKDGEEESHIHIETPNLPQPNEDDAFTVVLGEPTGGAMLCGETRCDVVVYNDVVPGIISFADNEVKVKQSEEDIKIPINRAQQTAGKVRVPWKTVCLDPDSPFANFSGIETFEDGDEKSHINFKIPQYPREENADRFDVVLSPPKSVESVLGDTTSCSVVIENDIAPAMIKFDTTKQDALQSNGILKLKMNREQQKEGRVIVPWKVATESPDSVYCDMSGETILESGDDYGFAEVNLPQLPLTNDKEKITVILEPPVGAPATLGDDGLCEVNVIHDIGEGVIEMRSRDVSCPSENGEALVAVVRKIGQDFPAEVMWQATDDDAFLGQHYESEMGKLKFKPGEVERSIHIPLHNDPSGEDRHFVVHLSEVKGRDRIGDVKECRVKIENDAMPPTAVDDFDADLYGPQNIRATWLPPTEGAKPTGYKLTYWSRPGTVKTVELPDDVHEATLDDLQPSTSYQVNVRPINSVGDGPASNTTVVETQPELRLSYQTPMQVKTSDKVATFYLKRNIKDFKDVVTWKIVKEIRKKKKSVPSSISSQSSSSSSSSSSDDDITQGEAPNVVSSGTLEFPPNTDHVTVNFPLKQDMRHSSQIYRMLVRREPRDADDEDEIERERPLANVELNVINDTGYPGRVRKPFAASATPFECTTSWEAPSSGGPVEGYKVIARTKGEPDLITTVGPDDKKTTLTDLKPSTNYDIMVQPFNDVGDAKMSSPTHVTTQDELKVEFSERFYSFKTSEKVAVIPLKRHFTHGYATLTWNVRWCKRSDQSDSSSSDSEGENEARGREWASGSVAFPDGADTAEVRIPLQQASPAPVPRKRSFFWLHVVDPNKKKRLAAMRCKLVDDKVYGRIGFSEPIVTVQGGANARDVITLPLTRHDGTDGHVTVEWAVDADNDSSNLLSPDKQSGVLTLCEGEADSVVPIKLRPDWVDAFQSRDPVEVTAHLESPGRGAELADQTTCTLCLIPAQRGVIEITPVKSDFKWLEHSHNIEFNVDRSQGSYGPVYLQWEIESSNGEEISEYFSNLEGDLHMANAETSALIKVPTKSNGQDIPRDFPLTLKTDPITQGVKLTDNSDSVPLIVRAEKGELTVLPIPKMQWPVPDNSVAVNVVREKGATGPIYCQWDLTPSDKSANIDRYFKETEGDFRMCNGEKEATICIPTYPERSQGPEEDMSVEFNLAPITDGVTMKSSAPIDFKILKPEPGGVLNFTQPEYTFKTAGVEHILIPLERTSGCGGDSTVTYLIRDQTTKAGVHYEDIAIAGEVKIKDKESDGSIKIPLVPDAKYRKPASFLLELIEITGDSEIGTAYETEVTLQPTYIEPPGVVGFVNTDSINVCVNDTDCLTVLLVRRSGVEGQVSVTCTTKEGSANEGEHYVNYSDVVTFEDGDIEKKVEIKLVPQKYRTELDFSLLLSDEKGGCTIGDNNKLPVTLQPTYFEPPGTFVTLEDEDVKPIVTSTLYQCPISRKNGSGGNVSLQYKTRDGTAVSGVHYVDTCNRLQMDDGQVKTTLEVPLLPEQYREELYFFVDLSDPEGGADIESNEMEIYLQPTDTEPCGKVTLPKPGDLKANATETSTLNVPISRNSGVGGDVFVSIKTIEGSAKPGIHYKPLDGKITLKDRQDKVEIPINLLPAIYREPLDFYVEIDKPEGGVEIGDFQKTRIQLEPTDTEPSGRLVFGNPSVMNEITCNANQDKSIIIPVKRIEGSGGDISVNYSTKDGNAKAGTHYGKVEDVLTLKDRQSEGEIVVPILPENYRNDLDFTVELDSKDGSNPEICKVILEATDTEPCGRVTLPIDDVLEVNAKNCNSLGVPISRVEGKGGDCSVRIKTLDGSAKDGVHFRGVDQVVEMKDRKDFVEVVIPLLPLLYRDELDFTIELSEPQGGVELGDVILSTVRFLPTDTEPKGYAKLPDISDNVQINANDDKQVIIPITRVDGVGGPLEIKYSTRDGTAKAGIHYEPIDKTLSFKDREDSGNIVIPLKNESYREPKTFYVDMQQEGVEPQTTEILLQPTDTEPKGYAKLPDISDDVQINANDDKQVTIPITRVDGVGGPLEMKYSTRDGTAKAGIHYEPIEKTLSFKDREDSGNIVIPLKNESYREPKTFYVDMQQEGVEPQTTEILLQPTDTEPKGYAKLPDISDDVQINANDDKQVIIPITRVDGVGGPLEIKYSTRDGTAKAGIHYEPIEKTLSFKDREDSGNIVIPLKNESYREPKTFYVDMQQEGVKPQTTEVLLPPTDTEPTGHLVFPTDDQISFCQTNDKVAKISLPRVGGCGGDLKVNYSTKDGSAKAGKHYTNTSGVLELGDREKKSEIEIPLLDSKYKEKLDFKVVLDSNENPQEANVNLEPTSVNNVSSPSDRVVVTSKDQENVIIPIKRQTEDLSNEVKVPFYTTDKTAKADKHYVPSQGLATIPKDKKESSVEIPLKQSEHTKPLSFLVNFDNDLGDDTTVEVELPPTKKNPPGILSFSKTGYVFPGPQPDSTGSVVKIPVCREEGDGGKVSVEYFTRDNTAMSGTHYDETTGFLEFDDGKTEKHIEVSLIPDLSYQTEISFVLELGAATGGAEVYGVYETEVKIQPPLDKNDPGVLGFESDKVFISSSKLNKKKRKPVEIEIPVRRTFGCGGDVSVDYFTRDNTAVSDVHYIETEGELKFADTETLQQIKVKVLPGKHFDKQCSFTAELGAAYGDAEVGIYETEVTLKPIASRGSSSSDSSSSTSSSESTSSGSSSSSSSDDENVFSQENKSRLKSANETTPLEIREYVERKNIDAELQDGPGEIGFSIERLEFRRGVDENARIPVVRRDGNVGKVSIDWFTRENTAVNDKDFVECDGIAHFAHGQSSTWITVPLLNRHSDKQDGEFKERTFNVELGQPEGGATLGRYETLVALREPDLTRLVAPKNAKVELQGPSSFVVSWEPQDGTVLEYLVSYKRAGSQEDPNRHTMPNDQYSFQVDDLLPESAYAVVVSALGEGGQQASSDVIGCKTPGRVPGPPNRLAFQVLSPTSLQCSWGEPAVTNGIIIGYEVLYKPKDPDLDSQHLPVMVRIPDGHYRSLLVENLEENCTYLYSVRAQNKCGLGIPREATMKIEHMGSRPPSAIFLDEENMKLLQEQIHIEQANKELAMAERARSISASSSENQSLGSENRVATTTKYMQGQQPTTQTKTKSSMKTRVTRYIHKDGQKEPEIETTEYDGKLSQEDLAKLAENTDRIECRSPLQVQVITYNSTSGVAGRSPVPPSQPNVDMTLSNPYAQEYSNTDVEHDVTQNTDVYTDVEESKEGDTDITTITKTYKTTTTERRLETTSGMRMMAKEDQSKS